MATKDLIRKMTSSRDIKPKVLDAKIAEVKVIEVLNTVEETVEHEISKIRESDNIPTTEFVTKEFSVLKQAIFKTQKQLRDMQGKIDATYGLVNTIYAKIEEAKVKNPSLWRRLFKKCQ